MIPIVQILVIQDTACYPYPFLVTKDNTTSFICDNILLQKR